MINHKVLKKWSKMLRGDSIFHVKQTEGKCYSLKEVKGYYNDLTGKISKSTILDKNGIPINETVGGMKAYFPITIFQYGLGLYDLYLINDDKRYLEQFKKISNWAIREQEENGLWHCMDRIGDKKHQPQSAMCQSEGASLLIRAYIETKDNKYLKAAKKSIDYMLTSVEDGGTRASVDGNQYVFQEYVSKDNLSVLNGWIFAIFGLYDYTLIDNNEKYKQALNSTVSSLANSLSNYDRKYWSNYDQKGTIASPAYNDLHVRQLNLLYKMFNYDEFKVYANKFETYQNKKFNRYRAMLIKLKQKTFKSKYYDITCNLVK